MKKKVTLLTLWFAIKLAFSESPQAVNTIGLDESHLPKIRSNYFVGKYSNVINLCHSYLAINPSNYLCYYYLGLSYYRIYEYENAIKYLSEGTHYSNYPRFYAVLGNAYSRIRQDKEALSFYQKSIDLEPHDFYSHNGLVKSKLSLKILESKQEIDLLREIDPANAFTYLNYAAFYDQKGEKRLSLKNLEKAFEVLKLPDRKEIVTTNYLVDFIKREPIFDNLRKDLEFQNYMKKLK